MDTKQAVKLAYKPALDPSPYVVTSTVNTLQVKVGEMLTGREVQELIDGGYTVKVTA